MLALAWPCHGGQADISLQKQPLFEAVPVQAVADCGGYVGSRIALSRVGSLRKFDIDSHVRMMEVRKHRDWWWIGEQPGKWLESAVLSAGQSADQELESKARAVLARMVAAQEPGGYLGITDPAIRTPEKPLRGMDPYEMVFTLHGLLTAAESWNDPAALKAARGLGDYLCDHVGPGKAEFWPSPLRPPEQERRIICPQYVFAPEGTENAAELYKHSDIAGHTAHYGLEGTLLIDPMLRLYQKTGVEKYLEWSKWVVSNIDKWSGWDTFSNLDKVADGTMGIHELQPYVHAHTFHINFLGFLRLYQITGDATLLRKVRAAWDDVASRQMYITGGVSVGEHYEPGHHKPLTGHVVETCASMSWLQLSAALLEITGEVKYADAIERLILNHVFASQTMDGDCYRYHTPPNGFKPDDYFHGPDCCTSSGHRLASMLPGFWFGQSEGAAHIHQYMGSSPTFRTGGDRPLRLTIEAGYPENEKVRIRVDDAPTGACAIHLRIPSWCVKPGLTINNGKIEAASGSYAICRREWKAGDLIELSLSMETKWIRHDHFTGGEAPWALTRGPVVYAVDTIDWNDAACPRPSDVSREIAVDPADNPGPQVSAAPPHTMGPALLVNLTTVTGAKTSARMLPFTNIGRWHRQGEVDAPKKGRAWSYAVWLQHPTAGAFKDAAASAKLATESTDFVLMGDAVSENQHQLSGNGTTGGFRGKTYRHVAAGGSFSYEMKVETETPTDLVVSYWGGEPEKREFDILANGVRLATQTLQMDKPEQFMEIRYPIPSELVKGRTNALGQKLDRITITFVASRRSIAGGVFGLRTVPAP